MRAAGLLVPGLPQCTANAWGQRGSDWASAPLLTELLFTESWRQHHLWPWYTFGSDFPSRGAHGGSGCGPRETLCVAHETPGR